MNPNLYRLHEIREIERGLNEEKPKHSAMIKIYHCLLNFCTGCFLIFQFCIFLLNFGFLSDFETIIGTISGKVLHGMNVFFVNASIFLKVIETFLFKKIQRYEKQKNFIQMQLNSIRYMVSKALSDDEISSSEFEHILFQTRKQNETYIKFEDADLEIDKMLPKKSENFV